jgi:hypothetical protein
MKLLMILPVLLLTACASVATVTPVEVKVPVMVPCKVAAPVQPVTTYAPPYTTVFSAVQALLADRELMIAYELELSAALAACR